MDLGQQLLVVYLQGFIWQPVDAVQQAVGQALIQAACPLVRECLSDA